MTLYVSQNGNDENSGRSAEDAYATLERARDEIRDLKRTSGLPESGAAVEISGGYYERGAVFSLTAEDSGTETSPIRYQARSGENVRISGGRIVDNFVPVTDPAILARLEPVARGKVYQADLKAIGISDYGEVLDGGLELFFNDEAMTVSRWPNEGFVKITDLVGGDPVDVRGTKGDHIGKFMYEGDRPERWRDEEDLWVHGYWFWDWSDQRHPVESIDTDKGIISVKPPYHRYGYRIGQWFYALNALSEIDMPREWYLDRETGILYFFPPSSIEEGRAVVSVLSTAVEMNDVSHVSFEGIVFEAMRNTAVVMSDGKGNRIDGCTLRNLGSAVTISGGSGNGVANCEIYELANGGIAISGGDRTSLASAGHYAENNDIHNYGRWNRMYKSAIGMHGVGIRASNNRIHDAPHMGIQFSGNDHVIEYNEIYNVCYESNDAGAIYAGRDWTMRGTAIRYNYIHDVRGYEQKSCVGVYLDDMFCGTEIYGNIFYNVYRPAFVGGGRDCTIENNVFVNCIRSIHIDDRAMNWASYHVDTTMTDKLNEMPYKSDLWVERYPELQNVLDEEPAAPKGNLVARNISIGGAWDDINDGAKPFVELADNLFDEDPHFVADIPKHPKPKSFVLADGSPAFGLGFKAIPVERIGLKR